MASAVLPARQTSELDHLKNPKKKKAICTRALLVFNMTRVVEVVACTVALLMCMVGGEGASSTSSLKRPALATMPLNRFPLVQAHDCGTGYLEPSNLIEDVVYAWTKTQGGNITTQLECGARYFDWRPALNTSVSPPLLQFHHGPVTVRHSMQAAAAELVAWAAAAAKLPGGGTEDELVILDVWDCVGGSTCFDAAQAAFQAVGIPVFRGEEQCAQASNFTLAQAMEAGALRGGGHAVARFTCPLAPWTTYDDRLSCTGFVNTTAGRVFEAELMQCIGDSSQSTSSSDSAAVGRPPVSRLPSWLHLGADLSRISACIEGVAGILDAGAHFACYPGGHDESVPWQRLQSWDHNLTSLEPPKNPALAYSIMGAWAEHTASVVLGFLHGSSLLQDEIRSGLNKQVAKWATQPDVFPNVPSAVGINAVCDGGNELAAALRTRLPTSWPPQ